MMSRPTFEDFKKKALSNSEVKAEYDNLTPEYELKLKLIKMRKEAGLTQEDLANLMHTKKSSLVKWTTC